jgi:hypothetical protein
MNLLRRPCLVTYCTLGAFLVSAPMPSGGAESGVANPYQSQVLPFLTKHCKECHGIDKPKGKFHLDRLTPTMADRATQERWQQVLEQIKSGAMPPKEKPKPEASEVKTVSAWITDRTRAAEAARRATEGRVVLRRLNRAEYQNTIRDLLGVQLDFQELLPVDSSADGFDNVGEALHTSSFLMERYLEAADKALSVAIANGPKPPLVKKRLSFKNDRRLKHTDEKVFLERDDAMVSFTSAPWQAFTLWEFYPPDRGAYRFRISAYGFQSRGKPVTYQVRAGSMLMAGKNHLTGYFDVPEDKPTVIEFTEHLEARETIRIHPYGLASSQSVHKIGADKYTGAGLAIQHVEVEGPLHETWPPPSHRRLFGDLPQVAGTGNNRYRLEVTSKNPEADAERILRDFTRRAFRRGVTDAEVKPFVDLVKDRLAKKHTFEQAMRVGLMGVMLSPDFLFLREKPGKLDDFALASRLSYFLWSTMPDEDLLKLAQQKKLAEPEMLRGQVERMLKDPKATAFTENFVGQWLNLRDIDFTVPSHILYPEYDDMLKASMLKETHLFFEEVLKNDLSLANFVASDFTMLNGRLAKHYGIAGADGWEFKKVKLPPGTHRGGVLTMASVLKVSANGTNTSPVTRGAYVLERILGTPPPRPPDGVPAVEPDIRGATTIRQQLAKHRETPNCATCHVKIDPPGFALESFDVIGGWRENYRTTGRGEPVMRDGQRMHYLKGPRVDPADQLEGGVKFADIDELKQLLLKDKDQLARALAVKLLTYGTGAAPTAGDKEQVETVVKKVKEKDYGFRTLVHEIVQSEMFRRK